MFHLESINMSYEVEWRYRLMFKKRKERMNEEELGECEIGGMNCKLQSGGQNAVTSLYKGKMLPSSHANDYF